jgi:hypothetical protein
MRLALRQTETQNPHLAYLDKGMLKSLALWIQIGRRTSGPHFTTIERTPNGHWLP